jgi:hypothetical protein
MEAEAGSSKRTSVTPQASATGSSFIADADVATGSSFMADARHISAGYHVPPSRPEVDTEGLQLVTHHKI